MINFSSKGKVHHSSSTRTKAKSTPEKPSPSKKALSHSPLKKSGWHNIFETSKAMLCFSPRSINCRDIIVKFAQPSFWQTFGLFTTPSFDTPFKLRQLFGVTSKREIPFLVESAIMTGQSVSEYVNLHRQDGVALSCPVILLCAV